MSAERLGIILILIGMSLFSIQDVFIKLIANQVSLTQILFTRASLGSIFLIFYLWYTKRPIKLGSAYPLIALLRSVSFFIGFTLFYVSISKISLAEANSLFFVNPIIVTVLSIYFLGVSIGIHRISSVMVGFLGTLLIVKPSFSDFNWYMLLPLITALFYSVGMLLAKVTSDKDNAFQQSFHLYLGGVVLCPIVTIIVMYVFPQFENSQFKFLYLPWVFNDIDVLVSLLIIALTGTIGIFCLVFAYNIGSPQSNAPMEYVLLFYSLLSGFFIFEEIPDTLSFLGILLIIGSGVYVYVREEKRNQLVAVEKER